MQYGIHMKLDLEEIGETPNLSETLHCANGPRVSGISRTSTVAQAKSSGVWTLPRGRHPILILLRNCLPSPPPSLSNSAEEEDLFLWKSDPISPPGRFSTGKTWNSLHPSPPPVVWHKSVWFVNHIPKHAFHLWVTVQDRLPTRDRLSRWGLDVPEVCLLCGTDLESRDHLLFLCSYSAQVWSSFFSHRSLSPPSSFVDIVSWIRSNNLPPKLKLICKLIFQAAVYYIWKERNARLHSPIVKVSQSLVKEIQLLLRAKLAGLDRSLTSNVLSSSSSQQSYLCTWFEFIQL
ncbi:unnamed protein product [Microthlaspi erraticum]|uniref:Reverse transcriptase zinc-binding domain-containing protein n=1 Tax=Microthlaspi erraticum TaxID=1685480 RepID=A0A6D2KCN7_9BRAS|nr:unnamed protein product [Microthlaspi erraticum]